MFFSFVLFKLLLLGSYLSDMYAKNMGVEDATSSFKRPRTGSTSYNSAPIGPICTQKYGRRGRDVSFPMIKLGSYWSDLDEKNVRVEGATCPFQ
ncbi:hypothetical protein V1477_006342 [Vespula maculifrons]|uniref:Uncharacterized protein n=1 Tax=Vespula maculifrons TaxID=7453 RepID=A0ABD2CK75_VESMC